MNNINDIIFNGKLRSIQKTVFLINKLNTHIKQYLPSPLNNQCFIANIRDDNAVIGTKSSYHLQNIKNNYLLILELIQDKHPSIKSLKFIVII